MNLKNTRDLFVSREHRYSLGVEPASGRCYVSIPVANRRVDYEEFYEIDSTALDRFLAEPQAALAFVERCRRREADDLLIYQPSIERGTPV